LCHVDTTSSLEVTPMSHDLTIFVKKKNIAPISQKPKKVSYFVLLPYYVSIFEV